MAKHITPWIYLLLLATLVSACAPALTYPTAVPSTVPSLPADLPTTPPALISPTAAPSAVSLPATVQNLAQVDAPRNPPAADWREWPVIPAATATAMRTYALGLALGNDPRAFSKVGDCQSIKEVLMGVYDQPGRYTLSDNPDLQQTIDQFRGSFDRDGQAVQGGFNTASVLSPLWANPDVCQPGENPLECEFRVHKPSIVIISLEVWWNGRTPERYEQYMRRIIQFALDKGVVPVLSTKADNVEGDHAINLATAKLAVEYDLPLWNWWRAAQDLPNHGLDPTRPDGFHISKEAWTLRASTALQTLDSIYRGVISSPPLPLAEGGGEGPSGGEGDGPTYPQPLSTQGATYPQPLSTQGATYPQPLPEGRGVWSLPPLPLGEGGGEGPGLIRFSLAARSGETLLPAGQYQIDLTAATIQSIESPSTESAPPSVPQSAISSVISSVASPTGDLYVYRRVASVDSSTLVLGKTGGAERDVPLPGTNVLDMAWSPDGQRVAVLTVNRSDYSGKWGRVNTLLFTPRTFDVQVMPLASGMNARVLWSPDGQTLLTTGTDLVDGRYRVNMQFIRIATKAVTDLTASLDLTSDLPLLVTAITWQSAP